MDFCVLSAKNRLPLAVGYRSDMGPDMHKAHSIDGLDRVELSTQCEADLPPHEEDREQGVGNSVRRLVAEALLIYEGVRGRFDLTVPG